MSRRRRYAVNCGLAWILGVLAGCVATTNVGAEALVGTVWVALAFVATALFTAGEIHAHRTDVW